MNPTVAFTLAVICTLYTAATAASLSRDEEFRFPLSGDRLRYLANEVDAYNALIPALVGDEDVKSILKRTGCSGFSGCAQLKLGQDALSRMLATDNSRFGSGGPGKRRRSVDAVEQEA